MESEIWLYGQDQTGWAFVIVIDHEVLCQPDVEGNWIGRAL